MILALLLILNYKMLKVNAILLKIIKLNEKRDEAL
jgi:hypothetical protein